MSIAGEIYAHGFNLISGIGPKRLKLLINGFPDLKTAWEASLKDLKVAGLEEKYAERVVAERKLIDLAAEEDKLKQAGIKTLTQNHAAYPLLLRETVGAPEVLYAKGRFDPQAFCLAVVGSRKVSPYGKRATEELAGGLAKAGIVIVSGMAYGVDYLAQNECVKVGQTTVAVLAGGLDEKSIYPAINIPLSRKIVENGGCLLSEYAPGTRPLKQFFPARNRIISGISKGTLIVEAGEKSGSLITASFALEQNREVFAVPGSIFSPNSIGTNTLIKNGAKPVTQVNDILEEFHLTLPATTKIIGENFSSAELALLEHLDNDEPHHIDELSKLTSITAAELGSILMILEIKNAVQNLGGMRYIKK